MLRFIPESLKEKLRLRAGAVTTRSRLLNLRRAGFAPRRIVDAGAFRGEWSLLARETFPSAELLLIEPQPHLEPRLRSLCDRLGRASLCPALLGPSPGECHFLVAASNSRIVAAGHKPREGEQLIRLPVRTLDEIVATAGFETCDFLKLDLQGHELSALEGAGSLFGRAEVIQLEVSWIPIGNPPLVAEVFSTFAARRYRPYDIMGFNHRPRDGALWQTDVIFVRHDSPLIASSDWS